jgi:hypothetical protein
MIMADSGNIVKKFAQAMYRDNSQDDPQYAPLEEEKSFLEQHGVHTTPQRNRRGVLRTVSYGLVLVSLVISVTLNAVAWRDLVELKQTSRGDDHQHEPQLSTYGNGSPESISPQKAILTT